MKLRIWRPSPRTAVVTVTKFLPWNIRKTVAVDGESVIVPAEIEANNEVLIIKMDLSKAVKSSRGDVDEDTG